MIVNSIDAEYALVGYDDKTESIFAARDAMGIRPLFYGHTKDGHISFASEVKALLDFCREIKPFPPGHYYLNGKFVCYKDLAHTKKYTEDSFDVILSQINSKLSKAVEKRLHADAKIGFLLSGGLDSSLVC